MIQFILIQLLYIAIPTYAQSDEVDHSNKSEVKEAVRSMKKQKIDLMMVSKVKERSVRLKKRTKVIVSTKDSVYWGPLHIVNEQQLYIKEDTVAIADIERIRKKRFRPLQAGVSTLLAIPVLAYVSLSGNEWLTVPGLIAYAGVNMSSRWFDMDKWEIHLYLRDKQGQNFMVNDD